MSQCSNAAGSLIWELENNPSVEARSAIVEVLEQMGTPAVDGLMNNVKGIAEVGIEQIVDEAE